MYQTGGTIREILNDIQRNNIVLPAIQREFVWQPEQIRRLFDSLMQGYPFGTFLYWQVEPENSARYRFYDFVLNYHEKTNPHCPALPVMPNQRLTAVLDGQQRLTALNIALRGSMAWKLPRVWWNNPHAFPKRLFHLDLLWRPDEDDESGLQYRFRFLTNDQLEAARDAECWFPVGDILSMNDGPPMVRWLNERLPQERVDQAYETLNTLYQVVHNRHLVAYYVEGSQDLERVLQIFIRTNNGATILSYSDLLLSVAVAQWTQHDAREEIHALVDELNGIGAWFTFPKDLVLRAGLMLSDIGTVGFKVENFNRENMGIFENKWDDIKRALTLTIQLVSDCGFNGQNLRAHNAILPIAYYLYMKNPGEAFLTHTRHEQDRRAIREWLIRSLLKSGVWGSGVDTLLTALRDVIKENHADGFPVARIYQAMARRGRPLVFDDDEIEQLADMGYGDGLTFALLSLLFDFVDLRNQFHLDHIFPQARLTQRTLRDAGIPDEEIEGYTQCMNGLANLQLLQGPMNLEKSATMPAKWLRHTYPVDGNRREYEHLRLLGNVPANIEGFVGFYEARRARLKDKIGALLGRDSQAVPGALEDSVATSIADDDE